MSAERQLCSDGMWYESLDAYRTACRAIRERHGVRIRVGAHMYRGSMMNGESRPGVMMFRDDTSGRIVVWCRSQWDAACVNTMGQSGAYRTVWPSLAELELAVASLSAESRWAP